MTDGDAQSTDGAYARSLGGGAITDQASSGERHQRGDLERIELTCFVVLTLGLACWCLLTWTDQFTCYGPSHIRTTTMDAATIRQAMVLFRVENPDATCPSMEDLVEGSYLDPSMRVGDAWDSPFRLSCDGRDLLVVSAGPDGKFGSNDDIE